MAQRAAVDPDKGLPDLVRELTGDSKRLISDEVRLAKLETSESVRRASKGALWLGLAFGVAVVMLVALTLFIATFFGRVAGGHYWVGALLAAAIDVIAGLWLLQKGLAAFKEAPYSLPETRASLTLARD